MNKKKFETALALLYPDFIPATADDSSDARIAILDLVTDALNYARQEGLEEASVIIAYALGQSAEEKDSGNFLMTPVHPLDDTQHPKGCDCSACSQYHGMEQDPTPEDLENAGYRVAQDEGRWYWFNKTGASDLPHTYPDADTAWDAARQDYLSR